MALADYRMATDATLSTLDGHVNTLAKDETLVLAKTELANIVAKLNALDGHIDDLAKDATLVLVKNQLVDVVSKLNTLAKDTTLQASNTELGLLAKDTTLQASNTALGLLAKDATLQASNTALGLLAKDATLLAMANALVDVLASVKSINGKYGVVVLDSGDILISKSAVGSKTVKTVLTELETAVAETPLSFTATAIPDTDSDYKITVTQGTPT